MFFNLDNVQPNIVIGSNIEAHLLDYVFSENQRDKHTGQWRLHDILDVTSASNVSGFNFDTQVNVDLSVIKVGQKNKMSSFYVIMMNDKYYNLLDEHQNSVVFNFSSKNSPSLVLFSTHEDALAAIKYLMNEGGYEVDYCTLAGLARDHDW